MAENRRSRLALILTLAAGGAVLAIIALCGIGVVGLGAWRQAIVRQQAKALADSIDYRQDVQYGTGGGGPLLLDIARPKRGDGPFPAVVCIHGGGWRGGDKSSFTALIQALAQRGYVAVTVRYRFAPAHAFPAQLEDVKCAVRYLRAHAEELKVDPHRIGAMGGSAGGHLALLLGTTEAADGLEGEGGWAEFSSEVQAVGSIAGPVDLTQAFPEAVQGMLRDLAGTTDTYRDEALRRASPIAYLSPDDPAILAIHGTDDSLVPYEQATRLIEACRQVGVDARLITIEGGDHGWGGRPEDWQAANERLIEFFDQHLKGNRAPSDLSAGPTVD